MTKVDFLTQLTPAALECEKLSGIPHAFTLAQGALESAWGSSVLATKGFNLFGVKADASWHGETLVLPTKEHLSGKDVTVMAKWRKYANWGECMLDHAKFFHTNPRYKHALETTDPIEFAKRAAAAGYATDPKYAQLLITIINSLNPLNLQELDKPWELQQRSQPIPLGQVSGLHPSSQSTIIPTSTSVPSPQPLVSRLGAWGLSTLKTVGGGFNVLTNLVRGGLGVIPRAATELLSDGGSRPESSSASLAIRDTSADIAGRGVQAVAATVAKISPEPTTIKGFTMITAASLQTNMTSINNIAVELENIAAVIPFLPASVQTAIAEIKILQAVAPAIIADLVDVVTKAEAAYAQARV
jgi:hypothetical protein